MRLPAASFNGGRREKIAACRREALQMAEDVWHGAVEPCTSAGDRRQQLALLGQRGGCGGERHPASRSAEVWPGQAAASMVVDDVWVDRQPRREQSHAALRRIGVAGLLRDFGWTSYRHSAPSGKLFVQLCRPLGSFRFLTSD
ncbi:hypothetical protein ACQ4PT_024461 [Festuca glaucescens]